METVGFAVVDVEIIETFDDVVLLGAVEFDVVVVFVLFVEVAVVVVVFV